MMRSRSEREVLPSTEAFARARELDSLIPLREGFQGAGIQQNLPELLVNKRDNLLKRFP
jgi:hypothetical protein